MDIENLAMLKMVISENAPGTGMGIV